MNYINCPNCGRANSIAENFCLNCGTSLISARSSHPFNSFPPSQATTAHNQQTNWALGGKVFLFYSLYNVLIGLAFLGWVMLGVMAVLGSFSLGANSQQAGDAFVGGIIFIVTGLPFIFYLLSPLLPKKPWHWSLGLILIGLSMLLCITLPFAVWLLVYWVKPETKAYFGRR